MLKTPETKTYTFSKVLAKHALLVRTPLKDELLEEIKMVLEKMYKHKIDQAEPWSIRIITDYLECRQVGLNYKGQRGKVVEALIKYGNGSLFWDELERTKTQRKKDWARVAFAVRTIQERSAQGIKTSNMSRVLMKQAIDWRKKLLVNPLSEAQRSILFRAERELGIYYGDLSPEENGEAWQDRANENGEEN